MPKSWSHGLFFNTDTDSKDRCNHNRWRKTLDGTEVHAQSSFLLLALHACMHAGPNITVQLREQAGVRSRKVGYTRGLCCVTRPDHSSESPVHKQWGPTYA